MSRCSSPGEPRSRFAGESRPQWHRHWTWKTVVCTRVVPSLSGGESEGGEEHPMTSPPIAESVAASLEPGFRMRHEKRNLGITKKLHAHPRPCKGWRLTIVSARRRNSAVATDTPCVGRLNHGTSMGRLKSRVYARGRPPRRWSSGSHDRSSISRCRPTHRPIGHVDSFDRGEADVRRRAGARS